MLKKILLSIAAIVVVVVLGFVVVVAMQPSEFHVSRSATMAAPAEVIFDQVNNFHHWDAWSPWVDLDPNAENSFEGPSSGEGAVFRWSGNEEVGEGSMTITDSRPHERILIRLDFVRPMEDTADVAFTFEPEGDQTTVTWSMSGKINFIGKAFCLLMNMDMDQMIGTKYEEGLARIKAIVEAAPREEADATESPETES